MAAFWFGVAAPLVLAVKVCDWLLKHIDNDDWE